LSTELVSLDLSPGDGSIRLTGIIDAILQNDLAAIRQSFEAFANFDPAAASDSRDEFLLVFALIRNEVCAALRNDSEVMPSPLCRQLALAEGSTFAAGSARMLRAATPRSIDIRDKVDDEAPANAPSGN
jgi:hypothetical protein